MLTTYRTLLSLLDRRQRWQAAGLMLLTLVLTVIETAGVASILPLLAVLGDPAIIERNAALGAVRSAAGLDQPGDFLILLAATTIVLIVGGQVLKALTIYLMTLFANHCHLDLGTRLISGYLRQPYTWFLDRHSAELGARVLNHVEEVVTGVLMPSLRMIVQIAITAGLLVLLVLVDPAVTAIAILVVGGSYAVIAWLTRRRMARMGKEVFDRTEDIYRITHEAFGGFKDVKLLGIGESYVDRFRSASERSLRTSAAYQVVSEIPRYALEAVVSAGMVVLLLVMIISADGSLAATLPTIGLFAFAGARMFPAIQQIYATFASQRYYAAALRDLARDLVQAPPVRTEAGAPLALTDRIELRDVSFRYPSGSRPSLEGVTLTIPARRTVGLIGPSGAGKTTCVDVLLGLLPPQSGALSVDGVPIGRDNLRSWQQMLGYVPQEIFLTDDTLAANIALGIAPDRVDMAAVERAAEAAELHAFVRSDLPQGYQTRLGERGVRLSGGQRQRVGIARALYRNPPVLVFDEATSALDTGTERAVMDAVRNLAHTKTIVIIAHRLSTVASCDTIYVLDDGRVVRHGPADQILQGLDQRDIA